MVFNIHAQHQVWASKKKTRMTVLKRHPGLGVKRRTGKCTITSSA
jgi:hypothetical protein